MASQPSSSFESLSPGTMSWTMALMARSWPPLSWVTPSDAGKVRASASPRSASRPAAALKARTLWAMEKRVEASRAVRVLVATSECRLFSSSFFCEGETSGPMSNLRLALRRYS